MMPPSIPVHRPYVGTEELAAVGRVFESRWLGMGAATKAFERRLGELLGVKHVIAANTGTAALHLALSAVGVGPGDEVIVPSLTFVSAIQAILATGASPVFCEVRAETLTIDVADALGRRTPRTRAVMPVDYGGLACEMDELLPAARAGGVAVVEDGAHAFGSTYRGRPVGSLADVTCFSFDPVKNITCGAGGALATDDDAIAGHVLPSRHAGVEVDSWTRNRGGRPWSYKVVAPGFRYHLSDINAAIGLAQLERLDEFRARKQAIVRRYDAGLRGVPGLALIEHEYEATFPFSYVVRVLDGRRDALIADLREHGIGTTVEFAPNHRQPLFERFGGPLPVTERLAEEIVSLPLYFEMSDADVDAVIGRVRAFLG